ncbi:MAG: serine/threonine protein kinase [Candidatus Eremiobacteraeota bacterium]|nr:serine/threonine protein kinase [Candidatus Eremiobacteraeota bacterium]
MHDILKPGYILKNRYRIEKKIGEGGFSILYRARDMGNPGDPDDRIKKPLIIKESRDVIEDYSKFNEIRFTFEREFRTLQGLKHEKITKAYDLFDENKRVYFAREYIEGTLFSDLLGQPLQHWKAILFGEEILEILIYLHKKGVVYRDLKPSNLMVTKEGKFILFDFGTARFYSPEKKGDTIELGTPGYAPPEQYNRTQTDQRSDIYAFGAIMHYMLTGENPEDHPFKFKPPVDFDGKIPERLSDIVMKCLDLDPDKRYKGAAVVLETLRTTKFDKGLEGELIGVFGGSMKVVSMLNLLVTYIIWFSIMTFIRTLPGAEIGGKGSRESLFFELEKIASNKIFFISLIIVLTLFIYLIRRSERSVLEIYDNGLLFKRVSSPYFLARFCPRYSFEKFTKIIARIPLSTIDKVIYEIYNTEYLFKIFIKDGKKTEYEIPIPGKPDNLVNVLRDLGINVE